MKTLTLSDYEWRKTWESIQRLPGKINLFYSYLDGYMSTPDQVSQIALGRRKFIAKEIILLMPYLTKPKNLTCNLDILVMHLNKHLQHFVLCIIRGLCKIYSTARFISRHGYDKNACTIEQYCSATLATS